MKLAIPMPELLSALSAPPATDPEFGALTLPGWKEASDSIQFRLDAHDPILETTRRRLTILSELTQDFPPVESTEKLIREVLEQNPETISALENARSMTRLFLWQSTISMLSQDNPEQGLIPLDQRPIEANFFSSEVAISYPLSELSIELLDRLVEKVSPESTSSDWEFRNCPELRRAVPDWFQGFGQHLRTEVFDTAVQYLSVLPEGDGTLSLNVIGRALYFAIEDVRFNRLPEEKRHSRLVAEFLQLGSGLFSALKTPPSAPSFEPDHQNIKELSNLDEISRATSCIAAERIASDRIRRSLIPTLVETSAPCAESYWAIHRERFIEKPAAIQNFGDAPFAVHAYTQLSSEGTFYSRNIGRLRSVNVICEGSFHHLPVDHLPVLSEKFFPALDKGLENPPGTRQQIVERLCLTQAFLTLAHFPFDAAGRTNEDFVVFYAKRMGVNFSLSNSGYRHHTSPLAKEFQSIEEQFKYEFDLNTLRGLGITPGSFDKDFWIDNVDNLVNAIHVRGNLGFSVEKSIRSTDFLAALEGDESARGIILRTFPSLDKMQELFFRALTEEYAYAGPELSEQLDSAVARSMVTPPWQFRLQLSQESDQLRGQAPGEAFLRDHLHERNGRFVSEKVRNHFDNLREALSKKTLEARLLKFLSLRT